LNELILGLEKKALTLGGQLWKKEHRFVKENELGRQNSLVDCQKVFKDQVWRENYFMKIFSSFFKG